MDGERRKAHHAVTDQRPFLIYKAAKEFETIPVKIWFIIQ
jgi:predicted class III extradiol MEMO1 family dioxygenase